jgi:Fe-S cluster assembly iron-binding protein IscA
MKITEQAQIEFKKALEEFNQPGAGIRVFSTQSCCGPSIQMDISTQAGVNETIISIDELDFYAATDLLPMLENITIDYGNNGFRLIGLEQKGCGCC